MGLTSFSVKNYQFTIIIFVLALALGLNSLMNMPRGEDPPFGAPIFVVIGIYPGRESSRYGAISHKPVEDALYNLGDVKESSRRVAMDSCFLRSILTMESMWTIKIMMSIVR